MHPDLSPAEAAEAPARPAPTLLTVLRRTGKNKRAAKRWWYSPAADRPVLEDFDAGMFFALDLLPVTGIFDLSDVLTRLERDPLAFVIRGCPKPGIKRGARVRRKKHRDTPAGQEWPFTDAPAGLPWVMLDFDKTELPPDFLDIAGYENAVLWLVENKLPPEFQDVTFHWQLSAKAGMLAGGLFSAHVWFWLKRPATDAKLRAWAKRVNDAAGRKLVDLGVFRTVQPHYTAAPIFEGVHDPVPRRSGLWLGLEDAVDFPEIEEPNGRVRRNGHDAVHGIGLGAARGFEAKLALLGDGPGLRGFHEVLLSATASYVARHGSAGTDVEALKARLREAIEAATKDPDRDVEGYLADDYLDDVIEGALDKFGDERPLPPPTTAVGDPTPGPEMPTGSAEEAASALNGAITGFLARRAEAALDPDAPRPLGAIAGPAGLGKTTKLLSRSDLAGLNVAYCTPEHRLSREMVAKLDPNGPPGFVILGRGQTGPDGEPMCRKADLAEEVARLGQPVGTTLCRKGAQRCEFYERCAYIRQFQDQRAGVRFMPHAYLWLPKPTGLPKPDLVVIDERFWTSALRGMNGRTFVPLERLANNVLVDNARGLSLARSSDASAPGQKAHAVFTAALAAGRRPSPADFRAGRLTAADCHYMAGFWYQRVETLGITPGMPAALQRKRLETARATEAFRLARFWRLLGDEIELERDRLYGLELIEEKNGDGLPEHRVVMRWSADLARWVREAPILLLDADHNIEITRRFLPDFTDCDLTTITAERRSGEFTQIADRPVSKSMLAYTGKDADEARRAANRRADLRALIELATLTVPGPALERGPTTLVGTFMEAEIELRAAMEGRPVEEVREDMKLGRIPLDGRLSTRPDIALTHWNATRGKDVWKYALLLILAGRPLPGVEELERLTRALFYRDPRTIAEITPDQDGRTRYAVESRAIRCADGTLHAVPVDVHPDPLCARMLWQVREAEMMQLIDRLRLIWRDPAHPCRVLIASNIPLPIAINRITTWNELMPNRFVRAFHRHPAMPLSDGELARVFPDLWPSENAVKLDRKGLGEKGVFSLKDILIGKGPPFPVYRANYRREGQRGCPSPAVVRPVGRSALRAVLESVVGPVASLEVVTPELPSAVGPEPRAAPEALGLAPCAPPPAGSRGGWRVCGRQAGPVALHPPVTGAWPDCGGPLRCRACRARYYERVQLTHPPLAESAARTVAPARIASSVVFHPPTLGSSYEP